MVFGCSLHSQLMLNKTSCTTKISWKKLFIFYSYKMNGIEVGMIQLLPPHQHKVLASNGLLLRQLTMKIPRWMILCLCWRPEGLIPWMKVQENPTQQTLPMRQRSNHHPQNTTSLDAFLSQTLTCEEFHTSQNTCTINTSHYM